jgi:hypothetical protein
MAIESGPRHDGCCLAACAISAAEQGAQFKSNDVRWVISRCGEKFGTFRLTCRSGLHDI